MTDWIYKKCQADDAREYRFERDPREFAQKHLWIPQFRPMGKTAYYAFGRDMM